MKFKVLIVFMLFVLSASAQDEEFTANYIKMKADETINHKVGTDASTFYYSSFKFEKEQAFYYRLTMVWKQLNGSSGTISFSYKPSQLKSIENIKETKPGSPVGTIRLHLLGKTALYRVDSPGKATEFSTHAVVEFPYLSSDATNADKMIKALQRLSDIYKEIEKADPFGT